MTKDPLQFEVTNGLFEGSIEIIHIPCGKMCGFYSQEDTITLNDLLLWGWRHECDEISD